MSAPIGELVRTLWWGLQFSGSLNLFQCTWNKRVPSQMRQHTHDTTAVIFIAVKGPGAEDRLCVSCMSVDFTAAITAKPVHVA